MHASGIADAFACARCWRANARAWAAPFGLFTGRAVSPEDPPPCCGRRLRPLVDVLVVFHVPLLAAATARVPSEERPGLARRALPLSNTQNRLCSPSLGLFSRSVAHSDINTCESNFDKGLQHRGDGTQLAMSLSLSPFSFLSLASQTFQIRRKTRDAQAPSV